MDNLSKEERSRLMSKIRGRDTAPEKIVRKKLFQAGFRYRTCDKKYPGCPDIVLPKYYAVIFVNGCFWHGHSDCKIFRLPKSNQMFWIKKISRNIERDQITLAQYKAKCWRVCVVWECALRGEKSKVKTEKTVRQIIEWLEESNEPFLEIHG